MTTSPATATVPVLVIGESLIDIVDTGTGPSRRHPGGSPLNVATGLGRLGNDVSLLTALGDDPDGAMIRSHLARSHVTLTAPTPQLARTSTAHARIGEDGSADYRFDITWDITPVPVTAGIIHTGSLATLLAPGRDVVKDLLTRHRAHTLISFDPNVRPALIGDAAAHTRRTEEFFAIADVVKLSDDDAAFLYPNLPVDQVAAHILTLGPRVVAITEGGHGSQIHTAHTRVTVAASSAGVVDTVGAGDSYMAGILHVLADVLRTHPAVSQPGSRPWSTPDVLQRMIDVASTCSAVTVRREGANLPWYDELVSTF